MLSDRHETDLNTTVSSVQQRYKLHNPSSPSSASLGSETTSNKQTHHRPRARVWMTQVRRHSRPYSPFKPGGGSLL